MLQEEQSTSTVIDSSSGLHIMIQGSNHKEFRKPQGANDESHQPCRFDPSLRRYPDLWAQARVGSGSHRMRIKLLINCNPIFFSLVRLSSSHVANSQHHIHQSNLSTLLTDIRAGVDKVGLIFVRSSPHMPRIV